MKQDAALSAALDLLHLPAQRKALQRADLPEDTHVLLMIVGGDEAVLRDASRRTERDEATIRRAAEFFVEQVLLFPEASSYRVLGARADATVQELRHNMTLLLKWLHPDMDKSGERTRLAHRVTRAWEDLKSEDRRQQYDLARVAAGERKPRRSRQGRPALLNRKLGTVRRQPGASPSSEPSIGSQMRTIPLRKRESIFRRALKRLLKPALPHRGDHPKA